MEHFPYAKLSGASRATLHRLVILYAFGLRSTEKSEKNPPSRMNTQLIH